MNAATLPLPTKQYRQNRAWIVEHFAELAAQYATGWIAVHAEQVLAAGPSLDGVAEQAERAAPPEHVAYQFVDDGCSCWDSPASSIASLSTST